MARSPSPDLAPGDADRLLDLAETAVVAAVHRRAPPGEAAGGVLDRPGRVFVTLSVAGALNGCIGSLDASEPIGQAIPRLAVAAAFDDPRLPPLRPDELEALEIEVSLLGPASPVPAETREVLRACLRPGVDGLSVAIGPRRSLFLPDVWASLPDPDAFVDRLLAKAGLRPTPWPAPLRAEVFGTTSVRRRVRQSPGPGATMPAWPTGPTPGA